MKFSIKDYLVLGVSLILAFALWMVRNLSLKYSDTLQCRVTASCMIEGHEASAVSSNALVVRCTMRGYSLIANKMLPDGEPSVEVETQDMHRLGGDEFYMTSDGIIKYFHEMFGDDAVFECSLTDTLHFTFPSVSCLKVPVEPSAKLDFKTQYTAASGLRLIPDSVTVYGDSSVLSTVASVRTRPLVLFEIDSDKTGRLGLVSPGHGVRMRTEKVDYVLDVSRYVETTLSLGIECDDVPDGVSLSPVPSTVEVAVRDVFPSSGNNLSGVRAVVSYDEYCGSRSGRTLVRLSGLPKSVISYSVQPAAVLCIRKVK